MIRGVGAIFALAYSQTLNIVQTNHKKFVAYGTIGDSNSRKTALASLVITRVPRLYRLDYC